MDVIDGIHLVRHNASGIDAPYDAKSYPFELVVQLSPPEFMIVAFVCLYGGTEEVVVRGKTRAALDEFLALNRLLSHPRLRRAWVTDARGKAEELQAVRMVLE